MDIDRFAHAVRWLPFALLPSAREQGRPNPEILELRLPAGETDWLVAFRDETVETVEAWPIDIVLKNFAVQAVHWYIAARHHSAGHRPRTTLTELRQWIAATRSLADRTPMAGPITELMKQAATQLDSDLNWPSQYFTRTPRSIDTKADADFRTSLSLWALDQLVRSVNESEPEYAAIRRATNAELLDYLAVPPTKFWPVVFPWPETDIPEPPFADYNEAQKRVSTLAKKIKPNQADALMVNLLGGALHRGHFGPDGRDRQPATRMK